MVVLATQWNIIPIVTSDKLLSDVMFVPVAFSQRSSTILPAMFFAARLASQQVLLLLVVAVVATIVAAASLPLYLSAGDSEQPVVLCPEGDIRVATTGGSSQGCEGVTSFLQIGSIQSISRFG